MNQKNKNNALVARSAAIVCFLFVVNSFSNINFGRRFWDWYTQNEELYEGRYPNSLLTLFYPYTLLRDVVLDQPISDSDVAFFWHIHDSDERVVKKILRECYVGLTLVELNDVQAIGTAKKQKLIENAFKQQQQQQQHSTSNSNEKKSNNSNKKKNWIVVTSPMIRQVCEIFTPKHFGRMFSFFRHPLDYELPDNNNNNNNNIMIEGGTRGGSNGNSDQQQGVFPDKNVDNWLTRLLANVPNPDQELSFKELGIAKHVIRETCITGTMEMMQEAMLRIGEHFGWTLRDDDNGEQCIEDALFSEMMPSPKYVDHDTAEWESFYEHHKFDAQLFELAESTFRAQTQTIIPFETQLSRASGHKSDDNNDDDDEND